MILPTHQLRSFLAVAALGSYTHAAEQLFLSQPGVHRHVRQLEATVGSKLVEQRGKRVVLTQHGRAVFEYGRRLAQEEGELLQRLRDDNSLAQGLVSIAAGTTAGEFVVPRIAVAFQERYPEIMIHVVILGTIEDIDRAVLERRFDLGFHSEPRPTDGVTKTPFLKDELIGIAPPGHRFALSGRRIAARTVATEPFVAFAGGPNAPMSGAIIRNMTSRWFGDADREPKLRLTVGTLEGIKTAVRQGAGLAIVSRHAVRDDDQSLAQFKLARPPVREFLVVTRSGGWEPNVVRTFREFAQSLHWLDPEEAEDVRVFAADEAKETSDEPA